MRKYYYTALQYNAINWHC